MLLATSVIIIITWIQKTFKAKGCPRDIEKVSLTKRELPREHQPKERRSSRESSRQRVRPEEEEEEEEEERKKEKPIGLN